MAKVKDPKQLDKLIAKVREAHAPPPGVAPQIVHGLDPSKIVPPMEPHDLRDLKLRQAFSRSTTSLMEVAKCAYDVVEHQDYTKFGFADEIAYFNERHGGRYRTVQRLLAIYKSILGLPAEEQNAALAEVCDIGVHKAAIIVPALKKEPENWKGWVQEAKDLSEAALQEKVTGHVHARSRGLPEAGSQDGSRFLRYILNAMPDQDLKDEIEEVFHAGYVLAESKNAVAVFLAMVREVKVGWLQRSAMVAKGQSDH